MTAPIYPVGIDSFGVQLSYAVPASTLVWVPITDVVNLTPPNPTVKKIDVTCITQGDSTLRFVPGANDPGTITFECIYTAANYTNLLAIWGDGQNGTVSWQIIMPPDQTGITVTFVFTGFILKNELSQLSESDKAVTIKTEVQIAAYITNSES